MVQCKNNVKIIDELSSVLDKCIKVLLKHQKESSFLSWCLIRQILRNFFPGELSNFTHIFGYGKKLGNG